MAPTGDDWPQLTRTYHWDGARLVCGAEFAGGTRPAQFVHILQVSPAMTVSVEPRPEPDFPAGYVRLTSSAGPFAVRFVPPAHATLTGNTLQLRHTGVVGKFGFRPQVLTGLIDGYELRVGRGAQTGTTASDPDEGFHAQVYLSGEDAPFVELEQLSPLFAPRQNTRFEIMLTGAVR